MDSISISWPVACPIREISAMTSKAYMRPWEPNLQQKDVACSAGDRHQGKFGQKPYAWEKKLEMGSSQLDQGTRSVVHESSNEFGQMIREKLQEFAMILSKEYHYNFPTEYFEDYNGSFNKEYFLKMEQSKEKVRSRGADSLPISNVEWKKCTGSSRIIKEECNISDDIGGDWHYPKGICDEQISRAAKAKEQSEIVERKVHIEENSSKHMDGRVAELFEIPIETSANIKGVGTVNEVNNSMETRDFEDERRLDKEIGVNHAFQGQEADNSTEKQAINQIGKGNCYEDGFLATDTPARVIVSLGNPIINHVWDEVCDGGLVSTIEEPVGLSRHFLCNQYVRTARARKFECLTIAGNGMFGGMSLARISSNVVKVCGFDKELWGQLVIEGQLLKRINSSCMVENEVLHKLDNANSQGGSQCFVLIKQNTVLEMQEDGFSKFLTRFQLRKRRRRKQIIKAGIG